MSVLDRAIVKAFERRRIAAAANLAAEKLSAAALTESASSTAAAWATAETAARLLAEDEDQGSAVAGNAPASLPVVSQEELQALLSSAGHVVSTETATSDVVTQSAPETPLGSEPPISDRVVSQPLTEVELESDTTPATCSPAPRLPAAAAQTSVPVSHSSRSNATAPSVPWKWPEICEQLDQFTGDGFRQLAKHLQFAAGQGHKVLAFVSSTGNTGRTSVVLTLARILALEGRTRALLIDADRRHPDLGPQTGLTSVPGLREVLHGQSAFQQTVVRRSPGQVELLPLRTTVSDAEWSTLTAPLRDMVKQVKDEYDLILVDAGVFDPETRLSDCWLRGAADAVITISRQLTEQNAVHEVLNWKQIGIESLGVIETFS